MTRNEFGDWVNNHTSPFQMAELMRALLSGQVAIDQVTAKGSRTDVRLKDGSCLIILVQEG
jgi:hypothetical protein